MNNRNGNFGKFIRYLFVAITAVFIVYPMLFAILTSLKTKEGYIISPFGLDMQYVTLDNYTKLITNFDFLPKLCNTILVVGLSLVLILSLGIPAAYHLSHLRSKKIQDLIMLFCFSFMFIPEEILILPEYNMMSQLGLINHYSSVIILFTATSLPETIFLLRGYFAAIPGEVLNAAKLDGADELSSLTRIVIPMAKAPIFVVAITTAISLWNAFLVPMLMLYEDKKTLLIPSLSGLITKHSTSPTYQMAGMVLSMVPLTITYLLFKRHIFENSLEGTIK